MSRHLFLLKKLFFLKTTNLSVYPISIHKIGGGEERREQNACLSGLLWHGQASCSTFICPLKDPRWSSGGIADAV